MPNREEISCKNSRKTSSGMCESPSAMLSTGTPYGVRPGGPCWMPPPKKNSLPNTTTPVCHTPSICLPRNDCDICAVFSKRSRLAHTVRACEGTGAYARAALGDTLPLWPCRLTGHTRAASPAPAYAPVVRTPERPARRQLGREIPSLRTRERACGVWHANKAAARGSGTGASSGRNGGAPSSSLYPPREAPAGLPRQLQDRVDQTRRKAVFSADHHQSERRKEAKRREERLRCQGATESLRRRRQKSSKQRRPPCKHEQGECVGDAVRGVPAGACRAVRRGPVERRRA